MNRRLCRISIVAMLVAGLLGATATAQDLNTLTALGRTAFQESHYAEAEHYYRLAIERAVAVGAQDSDRAAVLQDLATLLHVQARYEESEKLFQQVLVILRTGTRIDRRIEPIVLTNLATLYRETGENLRAESLLIEALSLMKKYLDPRDAHIVDALNNLGVIYSSSGKLKLAEKTFKKALSLVEQQHAAPAEVAPVRANLAALYVLEKKWQRAEPLIRRAVSTFEAGNAVNESDLARALNILGLTLLNARHDIAAAETTFRRSIEIRRRVLGPEHPSIAVVLSNLAEVLRQREKYDEAKAFYAEALHIDEQMASLSRGELASTLDGYATVLRRLKYDDEAAVIETRARFIRAQLMYTTQLGRRGK